MKSVGTRFLVPFGLLAVFISIFVLYQAYDASRRHADELISQQAALALEFNLSIREYASSKIRPAFEALVDKDTFMRETMSTSYMSRSIFEEVRKKFPDYIIRFASDNPRNPINRATPDELRMIEYFRENPGVERMTKEVRIGNRHYLAHFAAKRMTFGCMHCHGDPKDAPAGLVKRYGATGSFYRKVGDVAGLDTVAVPLDAINADLASEMRTESAILITGLVLLFGSILAVFRYVVTRRLAAMTKHFRDIAALEETAGLMPVPVSGYDEISVLGKSFNILLDKLQTARTSLEQQVNQRTRELLDTNERLQSELVERKRAQAELERSRVMLDRAQEIAGIGYWEFDLEKRSVWASSGARRIYGLKEQEWTVETVKEIPLPEYRKALDEEMTALIGQGQGYDIEFKIRRPSDREVIDIHSLAEYNPVEQKVFGVIQDISERKRTEEALQESEERYRALFENAMEGIFQTTLDGRGIMANSALARILGYDSAQEAVEKITDVGAQVYADPEERKALVNRLQQEGTVTGNEVLFKRADGTNMKVMLNIRLVHDKDGTPVGIEGSCIDITARWVVEEALKASEEKYRLIFENATEGIYQTTPEGRYLSMNPSFARMFGYATPQLMIEEIRNIGQELYVNPGDREEMVRILREKDKVEGFEVEVYRKDRSSFWISINIHTVRDAAGNILYLEGTNVDITERKQAQDKIRESEMRFKAQYHGSPTPTFTWRKVGEEFVLEDYNKAADVVTDGRVSQFIGKTAQEMYYNQEDILRELHRCFDERTICRKVLQSTHFMPGRLIVITYAYVPYDLVMVHVEDITEHKQAEDSLRVSEAKYRRLHDSMMDAFVSVDMDGTVQECNEAYLAMLGYDADEIKRLTYRDITPKKWHAFEAKIVEKEVLTRGYSDIYEKEYRRKNGTIFPVELRAYLLRDDGGRPSGMWAIIHDITGRKQAQERIKEANRRLENIIEFLPDATLITDSTKRIIAWNHAIEEMTGVPKDAILGKDHFEAMVPFYGEPGPYLTDFFGKDDSEIDPRYKNISHKGDSIYAEAYNPALYQGKGAYVWVIASPLYDNNGNVVGSIESIRDITDRKRAEEELKKSEEKYRDIFDDAVVGIYQSKLEGRYITVNPAFARIFGYDSPEEMVSGVTDIRGQLYANPEDRLRLKALLEENERFEGFDVQVVRKDGRKIWINMNAHNVRDREGKLLYYEGTCVDITDRKRAEVALRESERHLADIIEFLPDATLVIDREGRVTAWNKAMEKMTGVKARDMIGRGNYEYSIPFYGERRPILIDIALMSAGEIEKKYSDLRREGDLIIGETDVPVVRGQKRFLSGWAQPIYGSSGEIIGAIECIRDITDRRRAEEALEENEERYRLLAENASDIIFTMDTNLGFTYISPSVERIRGYTVQEAMSQSVSEALTPASLDTAAKVFQEELEMEKSGSRELWRKRTLELEEICKNGSTIWTETTFTPLRDEEKRFIGFLGITRDITERKKSAEEKRRLETQLTQAQKMESIGTLAGGIAHDFNNILSAIFGYAELAMEDVSEPLRLKRELKEILKAGDRAKDLVSQILTFSRKTETTYSPMVLRTIINESLKMLRSVIPTTIEIRQDLSDSGLVMSNPTQINQVMMNLCTNAVHAMDETGGVLQVSLKKVNIEEKTLAHDLDLVLGPYLMITVSDTGNGMPPEVMERIFEPYFTTKELGRGTGLGLSVVHGIVKGHKGAITCRSMPGQGTTFEVYLPEILSAKDTAEPLDENPIPRGTERILFIDDEPVLVDLAKKMLGKLGYKVIARTSSSEALELFREAPDELDLIITDMTMPGMTGERLSQEIMKIRPEIPIILCTGYSEHISEERAKKIGIRKYLLKPWEMKTLGEAIRNALDGKE